MTLALASAVRTKAQPGSRLAWGALASASGSTALAIAAPWRPTVPATTALLLIGLGSAALLVALERVDRGVPARAVLAAAAIVLVVAVAVPPRRSQDLWAYAAYGSLVARHDTSPYVHRPADYPSDSLVQRMQPGWRHTGSVYGPAFTALSAGIVRITGARPLLVRVAFQSIAAMSVAAILVILHRRARAPGALILVALQPLVAVSVVNGGHNDALVAALLLGAAVTTERRPGAGGVLVGAAASIKLIALLPGAGLAWWAWRRLGPRQGSLVGALAFGLPGASYLRGGGVAALGPLLHASVLTSRASVWSQVGLELTRLGVHHAPIGRLAATLVLAVGALLLAAATDLDRPDAAMAAPLLAYLLVGAYVLPWYLIWALPLAALAANRRTSYLLAAVSATTLLAYQYVAREPGAVARVMHAAIPATQVAELVGVSVLVVAAVRHLVLGRRDTDAPFSAESTSGRPGPCSAGDRTVDPTDQASSGSGSVSARRPAAAANAVANPAARSTTAAM